MPSNQASKRDIFGLIFLIAEIFIPIVVAIVSLLVDNTTFPVESKIAILSISIGSTIVLLQFSIKHYYDSMKRKENESFESIMAKLGVLYTEIELNEVYKNFLGVDEKLRPFIQTTLESNNAIITKYIKDKRTGALEISLYYKQLHICADSIIHDKNNKGRTKYSGEIWALSCFLDDEWGNSGLEGAWLEKLLSADKYGVPTRRLYIFPQDKVNILRNGTESDRNNITKFLTSLKPYCDSISSTQYANTTSFAIERDLFPLNLLDAVGKGFFATKLSTGEMMLIRDVSVDNLSSNNLGGEIDFNEAKIQETRESWERLTEAGTKLNKFLYEDLNPSEITISVLSELGITRNINES